MNAITLHSFNLAADRFDRVVADAFATGEASRHVRDRLIEQVNAGRFDQMLPRARTGIAALPDVVNRKAALNVIDFTFEPIVMQNMSTEQAVRYFGAVENTLHVREARGLDSPGPLWVNTVHHVCVFSVLFQLAAFLGKSRRISQVILLHQGQRPEPRLGIVSNLLQREHGIVLVLLPLQGSWFSRLTRITTPRTAIFYLTDMPPEAFPQAGRRQRGRSRLSLTHDAAEVISVETVSGSQSFACRLGATCIQLDYPSTDSILIRPSDGHETALCPLEDWAFWPLLGDTAHHEAIGHDNLAVG